MIKYIILTIFLNSCFMVVAQDKDKLDSLFLVLAGTTADTLRIDAILEISHQYRMYNYTKSLEFIDQAISIAQKAKLKKYEVLAKRKRANLFLYMGDYKNASIVYYDIKSYYEKMKDTLGLLAIYNNLGVVYDRLGEYDNALNYYFYAKKLHLSLVRADQQLINISVILNNIANIYQTKGDTSSALQYYRESLTRARTNSDLAIQGTVLNNMGKLFITDMLKPHRGFKYLLAGLSVRESIGDKAEIAKSKLIIGDYYLKEGKFAEAQQFAGSALELAREVGSLETEQNAYLCLSEINESTGNHVGALDNYKLYKVISDSIINGKANNEITRLQLEYDFDKAEQIRQGQIQEAHVKYRNTIIILSLGLLIVFLILMIIRIRNRQTQLSHQHLVRDVEVKNKELTTNVMYLIRKNELINNVAERLLTIQSNIIPENYKVVNNIIFDLQREADNDSWEEFELRFNQVHSDFYERLRGRYPDLSPAEEKLCAFLRLNMHSKEIAAITQQSIKSIEVARARLRKKMNLTNTTTNLVMHLSTF